MANKFKAQTDRFLGVTIDCSKQNFTSDELFIESLKDAMKEWKEMGKRGLWVKVDKSNSSLVPLLTQLGFDFHHAQPGYVMMTLWMAEDTPSHLPEYANHYIGVAGFVINASGQLLVVREKYHAREKISAWKLPGGHVDKGEDLADTAKREVLEETGIESEFVSLITFRHQHNYRFGCSDIYFVCLMRPLTTEIKACPVEIADCRWMDLEEYISSPDVSDANRHFAQCYRDNLQQQDLAILPTKILSFDKKTLHNVYSIQNSSNPIPHHQL